jgi:hypothetical protein
MTNDNVELVEGQFEVYRKMDGKWRARSFNGGFKYLHQAEIRYANIIYEGAEPENVKIIDLETGDELAPRGSEFSEPERLAWLERQRAEAQRLQDIENERLRAEWAAEAERMKSERLKNLAALRKRTVVETHDVTILPSELRDLLAETILDAYYESDEGSGYDDVKINDEKLIKGLVNAGWVYLPKEPGA